MKKNWVLRLGLLAMVLTLVTMPMVSSTYAKYVTEKAGTATARVAKWGVEIDTTAAEAFAETYKNGDEVVTVMTSTSDVNMVAPGTSGTFAGITITGTPEVAVNVTTEATLDLSGWTVEKSTDKIYLPIVITISDGAATPTIISGLSYDTMEAFENAVANALIVSKDYDPGVALSVVGTYSWAWAFETSDGAGGYYDVEDTALGKLAADGSAPTISLEISVTVTQID